MVEREKCPGGGCGDGSVNDDGLLTDNYVDNKWIIECFEEQKVKQIGRETDI